MEKGKLFMARHWETESNITWAIVWITDVWLTENWVKDAHLVWSNVGLDIDLIITSPQIRAVTSSNIIRKYNNAPIVEHPTLHPQNFWVLEWLTLSEVKEKGLEKYIHTSDTNKYLHEVEWWETPQEMESRVVPEIYKLLALTKKQGINILLLSHNSIARCLSGNANGLLPQEWINLNIWNTDLLELTTWWMESLKIPGQWGGIKDLLWEQFIEANLNEQYWDTFLSDFARLSLYEEASVLSYLWQNFDWHSNVFLDSLIKLLENTITLNNTLHKIEKECDIPWVYSVLHFWSSVFWKNYSVKEYTDLDIELIVDENFDINLLKDSVLSWYSDDIEKDFSDFIKSWGDYFSFKSYYDWRLIDFRITHKECFDKICWSSLEEGDSYIMKEFRKQFRENWIIVCRKDFDWEIYSWDNAIDYSAQWQIIHYPLFTYEDWNFVAWNNLDKYCSFTEWYKNETDVKIKLFNLRKSFNNIFSQQKNWNFIEENAIISDIFIRKDRFPKFLIEDLEYRYRIYKDLFDS